MRSVFCILWIMVCSSNAYSRASTIVVEPTMACVMSTSAGIDTSSRASIASCLGWVDDSRVPLCRGYYRPLHIAALDDKTAIEIESDHVSLYPSGLSHLVGHVEVRQTDRIVNAQTATIYRDARTQTVTRIELLGQVQYIEPGRLMRAKRAVIHPQDKAGHLEDVFYRFDTTQVHAVLPAWGKARWMERLATQDYILRDVTYTTCSVRDKSWYIAARELQLHPLQGFGVARHATLNIADHTVAHLPDFSFPTSRARKSGWLIPMVGYSNVGGFDVAVPYYWNIAPNYDATFVPHAYSRRGLMAGGDFRFLTEKSFGVIGGQFLPKDAAFNQFLMQYRGEFPILQDVSTNRWSVLMHERTHFTDQLDLNINFQQVSDDYFLQDFSSNLATLTENQLLREGKLTYNSDHWLLQGMVQNYQTLHPVNQSFVTDIYARLPQLMARGVYQDLPLHGRLRLIGQLDEFHWTDSFTFQPEGPRVHVNPILSWPYSTSWGYVTPEVQVVENYYRLSQMPPAPAESFNHTIPRFSVDSGLTFERYTHYLNQMFTQTLEPRLYYLNVPYQNQSAYPSFDSAYMIFNTDQLFRNNRFSGFDRISDANQLAYALTTRLLSTQTGGEKASLTVGQIKYFSKRRVQLCYAPSGECIDPPFFLGYLSPDEPISPIASKAMYAISPFWTASADYVWDVFTHSTNNGNLNLHYQPELSKIVNVGYSYLVSGNLVANEQVGIQPTPLHQATVSYAWPLTDKWSSLGVYSYNISTRYDMVSFLGVQYDTCCWAARLLGGRTFQSLSPNSESPHYNNNVYFQILLKGLGGVANSDPSSMINSYLPGYHNVFQRK